MPGPVQLRVLDHQQVVYTDALGEPIELGRQKDRGEALYTRKVLSSGGSRTAIAGLDEDTVSRQHVYLEPLEDGRLRLKNLSGKVPVHLSDGTSVPAGGCRELSLPLVFTLGRRTVRLDVPGEQEPPLRGLSTALPPPGQASLTVPFPTLSVAGSLDIEALLGWLQTTVAVLQSAATSSAFFEEAARAVVDIAGCDCGRVLLVEDGRWRQEAVWTAPHAANGSHSEPSRMVLDQVRQRKRTFWISPEQATDPTRSLAHVEMVVAAPILDRAGNVIGALYGDCRDDPSAPSTRRLTEVEAMLVQLLAGSVAIGLARERQEQAALEAKIRFEQFFTPQLCRELERHRDLLEGRDVEATLLFCDIRGFSRISERLSPAATVEWLFDVMGTLSECVLAHDGVLVDHIGDALFAMWGAPEEQPDHARRACRAALDMLARLPELNDRWQARLGEPLDLGVGVNTGKARVGNVGSRQKFKYGPLGATVNLASRVEGATKYLRCRLVITEHTRARLDDDFATRRLGKVRLVNLGQPVELYELVPPGNAGWLDIKTRYEAALAEFEQGRFQETVRLLGNLIADDGPSLVLMTRAGNCWLAARGGEFDPVWDLPGK